MVERDYTAALSRGGLTIDRRDIDVLEAIEAHGSLHGAAEALGRSYARCQRRIVELEDAVGQLTERQRGGVDGGGTVLTERAHRLCRQFERHETELDGVTGVETATFRGQVVDRTGELGTVATDVGHLTALVPADAATVELSVRSDAVVLAAPDSPGGESTSLRNRLTGSVEAMERGTAVSQVTVAIDEEHRLRALVTAESVDRLELAVGVEVSASFKATATRAVSLEDQP